MRKRVFHGEIIRDIDEVRDKGKKRQLIKMKKWQTHVIIYGSMAKQHGIIVIYNLNEG